MRKSHSKIPLTLPSRGWLLRVPTGREPPPADGSVREWMVRTLLRGPRVAAPYVWWQTGVPVTLPLVVLLDAVLPVWECWTGWHIGERGFFREEVIWPESWTLPDWAVRDLARFPHARLPIKRLKSVRNPYPQTWCHYGKRRETPPENPPPSAGDSPARG